MPTRIMIISTLLVFCFACGDDGSDGPPSMECEAEMGCAGDGGVPTELDGSPTSGIMHRP